MPVVGTPLQIPELDLKPEWVKALELSEDMQQTLALLTGYWRNTRVLLKASPSGILFVTSPQTKDSFHVTATGANYTYQGDNIECSEVMIMAHPDNTGRVWVKPNGTAAITNAVPLEAGEVWVLTLTNLNMINLLIAVSGEKAIIAYTI